MAVRFRLLGAIEAELNGRPLVLGYAQLRCMLAVLLVEVNQPVSIDQLIDRVWSARRLPNHPRRAVQHNIPLLRQALAPVTEVTLDRRGSCYQLSADPGLVDLHRFHALLDRAHAATDDRQAVEWYEQALELWRGEPFADVDTPWLHTLRTTLIAHHHTARLDLTDLRLSQGEHAALLPELAERTSRHPLDERLAGQYLLALYRSGRQAEALAHYHDLRGVLADELGADPGSALRELHHRILTGDPTLTLPVPAQASVAAGVPVPRQLPAPPRLFTGRATELAALDTALDHQAGVGGTVVISTVGGSGGVGKTWLVLHWAHRQHDRFPDGQMHVNLRGFDPVEQPTSPGTAVRGFLDTLGVAPSAIPVDLEAQIGLYRSLVAGRRMLIVLDNARDSDQVSPLLPGSPACTVLVTSRNHLSGLVTAHGARILDLDVLPELDARRLLERHLGHDRITAEPDAVADLLAYCSGLPLALGILAARAQTHPTFPLAALAEELRDASARLDGLDAGDLRVNLRAVLSWSVRALGTRAANLFALLGVAPGPDISLPAAASLAGRPVGETRTVLRELEHASLIQQHIPGRYRMHDLVRLYATDIAHHDVADDTRETALRRVLDFYTRTAGTAGSLLDPLRPTIGLVPHEREGVRPQPLADVPAALSWLDTEISVLLAAQRSAARHGWHATVWELAWALNTFMHWREHRRDLPTMWQSALDAAAHLPDPVPRIVAHRLLGSALASAGRHEEGIEQQYRAIALAEKHGDVLHQARGHTMLARIIAKRGDDRVALDHATRGRDLFHTLDMPVWEAEALDSMGWCAARLGDLGTARAHCQAALTLLRGHDHPDGEATTLSSLGYIAHRAGDHRESVDYYQQALALFRRLGNTSEAADTLDALGHPHVALGEHEQARTIWLEALHMYQDQAREGDAKQLQRQLDDLDT